jgi:cyclase
MKASIPAWDTQLSAVAPNVYAYVQAGGPSVDNESVANAGLVVGENEALVVDTLTVPAQTRPFIDAIRGVTSLPIRYVVNTHHHADHTFGNSLFPSAEIIGHEHCRTDTIAFGLPVELIDKPEWQEGLDALELAPATTTFSERLDLDCGGVEVQLLHHGVAHTTGDALVYLPAQKVLFAGDVAFHFVTPLALTGAVGGWLATIERLDELEIDVVVPGHGPVGTMAELHAMRDYLVLIERETRPRWEAGMAPLDAALEIDLGPYAHWINSERIAANVLGLYAELDGDPLRPIGFRDGMAAMREYARLLP